MSDLTKQFSHFPAEKLHYIYGVNCYQHAIGFKTPVFSRVTALGRQFVNYVRFHPGSLSHQEPELETTDQFKNRIISHCQEDGLIFSGNKLPSLAGHRAIALYTRFAEGIHDFHFAYFNEKELWESKLPFQDTQIFATAAEAGLKYDLQCYFLCPKDLVPLAISEWVPRPTQVNANGRKIDLLEIDNDALGQRGNNLIFDSERKLCFLIEDKALLPLPQWPPIGSKIFSPDLKLKK